MSNTDATTCEECGVLVTNKAKHRRWHRNVVTVRDEVRSARRARFLGEPDADELADGYDDGDDDAEPRASRSVTRADGVGG